jgi:7-cyano-7-deazaguanine synthase in queuosine biosynthesis
MKPTGLFFTGGVESTLLLYQLSKTISKINLYTITNPYINLNRIETIINYVNGICFVKNVTPFLIPWKESTGERTFIRWAQHLASVELNALYIGSNEHMDHLPKRQYVEHKKIVIPFRDLKKDEIVKMYIENNLLDLLFLTHSCFSDKNLHCNTCGGCVERRWAFERNNLYE